MRSPSRVGARPHRLLRVSSPPIRRARPPETVTTDQILPGEAGVVQIRGWEDGGLPLSSSTVPFLSPRGIRKDLVFDRNVFVTDLVTFS